MANEPNWVRPVYLHVASLFGIALMAFGAIGLVMGLVHVAAPDLKEQSDPIGRLANTLVGVVQVALPTDQIEGGESIAAAIRATKDELKKQARHAAANDLMGAAVMMLVGGFVYRFHEHQSHPAPQTFLPPAQQPPPPAS